MSAARAAKQGSSSAKRATAFHALRVAGLREGQHVAILGFGGLGVSALLLSRALGAGSISVVDVVPEKLKAADHLRSELVELLQFAGNGTLKLDAVISRKVPLDAAAIDSVLDDLERGTAAVRSVIVP